MKQFIFCALVLFAGQSLYAAGTNEALLSSPELIARSLVSAGHTARLQHALAKARRGEAVTVAVIGGSITAGAKATKLEDRYGNRIAAWWRETFPKAKIEFVNAGIGATGSNYGALRAQRDLLAHHPDCVVVEYAVNDGDAEPAVHSMEGLVRQILAQPNSPAVVMLFMVNRKGGSAQAWHAKVGQHYGLPMISYRDVVWPEIAAKRLTWDQVSPDDVHPNDLGHARTAQFVTTFLAQTLAQLPADEKLPAIEKIPAPLFTDLFERTSLCEAGDLKPTVNQGWTYDATNKCWKSILPGSVIEFQVQGKQIYFMYYRIKKAMGQANVQLDDAKPQLCEAWFDQTWGGYRVSDVIGKDLPPGPHRVRVELLPTMHAGSTGHEFRILGLGAAGVP